MRNAGGKPKPCNIYQTCSKVGSAAVPLPAFGHPFLEVCLPPAGIRLEDSLRSATLPGRGYFPAAIAEDIAADKSQADPVDFEN